jgi:hypothetical protein
MDERSAIAVSFVHRNSVPSVQTHCRMTANQHPAPQCYADTLVWLKSSR